MSPRRPSGWGDGFGASLAGFSFASEVGSVGRGKLGMVTVGLGVPPDPPGLPALGEGAGLGPVLFDGDGLGEEPGVPVAEGEGVGVPPGAGDDASAVGVVAGLAATVAVGLTTGFPVSSAVGVAAGAGVVTEVPVGVTAGVAVSRAAEPDVSAVDRVP
ncbi:hypothetical protein [Microtetraspora niveoalba]|uniref:hypothetical protein n=1 Tax=Microtetraspora niveoalba TaxID=46175 RepID=UPI0012F92585|nr:hypothetical protein [Microtetraspora niveoalba]